MDFTEFQAALDAPEAVYIVKGDAHLRRQMLALCREQVSQEMRPFDFNLFDLEEDDVAEIVNAAQTLPWGSSRRWVYVKNAEKQLTSLKPLLGDPPRQTVLVVESTASVRGVSGLSVIEGVRIANPQAWVRQRVQEAGYEIEKEAVGGLVELVGEDLERLDSELEKLFLYHHKDRRIGLDSVSAIVFGSRDYDIFSLINAVATSDRRQALKILERLLATGMAPQQVLAMLYWNFRRLLVLRERLEAGDGFGQLLRQLKVWSYRGRENQIRQYSLAGLRQILVRLQGTDRLLKTTSSNGRFQLERLLVDTT